MIFGVIALIAIGIAVYWVVQRHHGEGPERQLQRLCSGDEGQAARLMEYEMGRAPGISRKEAATRAIESWRRDNR